MAKQIKLSARPRQESGKNAVKRVRARAGVPAIIYGGAQVPTNLEVSRKEIEQILAHAAGENILVELEIENAGKKDICLSLIQEVQHHPVRGDVLHVDFQAVSATELIEAEIPLEPVGEADGVKNYGGILEQSLRTLLIECFPKNLPELIQVDVSALKVGEAIHVSDIKLPEGVTAVVDKDLTVFLVAEPNVAVEASSQAAATEPEVLKEKKPAAEGGAAS